MDPAPQPLLAGERGSTSSTVGLPLRGSCSDGRCPEEPDGLPLGRCPRRARRRSDGYADRTPCDADTSRCEARTQPSGRAGFMQSATARPVARATSGPVRDIAVPHATVSRPPRAWRHTAPDRRIHGSRPAAASPRHPRQSRRVRRPGESVRVRWPALRRVPDRLVAEPEPCASPHCGDWGCGNGRDEVPGPTSGLPVPPFSGTPVNGRRPGSTGSAPPKSPVFTSEATLRASSLAEREASVTPLYSG